MFSGDPAGALKDVTFPEPRPFPNELQLKLEAIHKSMNLYKARGFALQTATFF
jgi:hypothetical protein